MTHLKTYHVNMAKYRNRESSVKKAHIKIILLPPYFIQLFMFKIIIKTHLYKLNECK